VRAERILRERNEARDRADPMAADAAQRKLETVFVNTSFYAAENFLAAAVRAGFPRDALHSDPRLLALHADARLAALVRGYLPQDNPLDVQPNKWLVKFLARGAAVA
jgi:hypothetical protein